MGLIVLKIKTQICKLIVEILLKRIVIIFTTQSVIWLTFKMSPTIIYFNFKS